MTEAMEFHNDIEIHTIHVKLGLRGFLFISLNAESCFLNIYIVLKWIHCLSLCKFFFSYRILKFDYKSNGKI